MPTDLLILATGPAASAAWLVGGFLWLRGMRRLPVVQPQPGKPIPPGRLAIVLAACNEADSIGPAMESLLAHAPDGSIVVAVDDRSTDATAEILDSLARRNALLRVIHVEELPPGWLGKTHALAVGAAEARRDFAGTREDDFVLFTDADVVFHDGGIEAAWRLACERRADHLMVFPEMVVTGFWERVFLSTFTLLFGIAYRVWDINRPRRRAAAGVGAFNLVRTRAYERAGGHRSIALEIADDVKLGKRLRATGATPLLAVGTRICRVRWQHGLSGHITGLTKNAFSGFDYSLLRLVGGTAGMLFLLWPFLGVWLGPAWARILCGAALAMVLAVYANGGRSGGPSAAYFLTYPVGTLFFLIACWRSAVVTLKQGGVTWRETFYPLELLRARPVPAPLETDEVETP